MLKNPKNVQKERLTTFIRFQSGGAIKGKHCYSRKYGLSYLAKSIAKSNMKFVFANISVSFLRPLSKYTKIMYMLYLQCISSARGRNISRNEF